MRLAKIVLLILVPLTAFAAPPPGIPDGWSDGFAYANGIRIHYYRAVPAPGKTPMVMVHGVTDIGLNWATLSPRLQDTYDIYMLDARGHGLTDPFTPNDDGDTMVKDVVEFIRVMKLEKPILMGHSMGAATVMRIGAEYPDLAKAIIMLDPGLGPRGPGRGTPPGRGATQPNAAQPPPSSPAQPQAQSTSPNRLTVSMRGTPEALVAQNNYSFEDLVALCQRQNPKWSLASCQYWALSKKQYHGAYSEESWQVISGVMRTGDSLAKIVAPALILKADASPEVRQRNLEAASVMPNGRLVHIDGGGHNLHHDEPERTLQVLTEFLSTL